MNASDGTFRPELNVPAGVLAWVCPGLGHIMIGQRRRGVLIMIGVMFLFSSGVLVGGVDVVDRRNDFLWFVAQAGCGPVAFAVDLVNRKYTKQLPLDWTSRTQLREQYLEGDADILQQLRYTSVAHVNEVGTLFCALAGLMNVAIILDALYFIPKANEPKPGSPGFVERRVETHEAHEA